MREAPALSLIRGLVLAGARVRAFDPQAMPDARSCLMDVDSEVTYCRKSYEACEGADGLVLVTEWNEFRHVDPSEIKNHLRQPVVFDGRNIWNPSTIRASGLTYYGIGV